jgi:glutamyl-Q tRNA(Asp) synthetase
MAAGPGNYKSVSQTTRTRGLPAYRGRFAPSPTGPLHFGSLVAAVGSYLRARSLGGQWLIRIEDIDPPREVDGAALSQLDTLRRFGMIADEPVTYQSRSAALHQAALQYLLQSGQAFECGCSRRDLPESGIYPGTCRNGLQPGQEPRSVRMRVDDRPIRFKDAIWGACQQNPATQVGDFVIRRADGLMAYQLAVVVDDAASGITEVVRGADLIESTGRQILIYQALKKPVPDHAHLPVIVDEQGRKLSKSQADDPVHLRHPATTLRLALRALNHEPPKGCRSLETIWSWASRHFDIRQVPVAEVAIGVHPNQR